MKTLIIHPEDYSTNFLKKIYAPIKDATIINGGITKKELENLIIDHDRIMMMGHGTTNGLLSVGQFLNCNSYIIDNTLVNLLKEKENNIFIWCNADVFVEYHNLNGFYSGMFISEVSEANFFGINTDQEEIDESNYSFANFLTETINEDNTVIFENIKKNYGELTKKNKIAKYNNDRLYIHI
jgi:hypothetical protein